jgi:RNA polymerase sigma-70 factor (ECF subfamily)
MAKFIERQTKTNLTEAEAIRQAKDGDAAAFECLYQTDCKLVYGLCFRMIKNPAEAEDLTQRTFLQVCRKIGTFRGESGFSTWLYRVTANVVLMYLRRKQATEIPAEDLERPSSNGEFSCEYGSSNTLDARCDRVVRPQACGPQVAWWLQKALLAARRLWIPA